MYDFFSLINLGVPFIGAAAVYALFNFLDRKASDAANHVVASWLKGRAYKRAELAGAMLHAFDALYRAPLFTLGSFIRSLSISVGVVFVWWSILFLGFPKGTVFTFVPIISWLIPVMVVSDYVSLFVVRKCLTMTKINLGVSILVAFGFGAVVVEIVIVTTNVVIQMIIGIFGFNASLVEVVSSLTSMDLWRAATSSGFDYFLAPALIVHLWLPIFLFGALSARVLDASLRAVGFARWFIRQGEDHPFDAIGITATVMVFVAIGVVQGIMRLL